MKKKLFSFTLLSATLLSLSACGLSNATSQSSSEVTGTSEVASSQTTATSSEATNIDLDIDTKNLKIYRNSKIESYTVDENLPKYDVEIEDTSKCSRYVAVEIDGIDEIETMIIDD